jgi:lipoate-protein ligase B
MLDKHHSSLTVYHLGVIPYLEAREVQEQVAEAIVNEKQDAALLLLEHPHTYTFGRRGDEKNLLLGEDDLRTRAVEIHWIDRGGDVTYHGPGQLVGYPILPLGKVNSQGYLPQADYTGYLRLLEQVVIYTLAEFGLVAGQIPGLTGVWVQPDVASRCPHCPPAARQQPSKIASIGVKVDSRGISRHGFALNVNPDMTYWDGIVACGLADYPAVSLADLFEHAPTMDQVRHTIVASFQKVFGFQDVVHKALDHGDVSKMDKSEGDRE